MLTSFGVNQVNTRTPDMKAMVMTAFGDPDVLALRNVPEPIAAPEDLLIEVRAAGVNPVDCKTRVAPRWGDREPPMILGFDVAGVVRSVGAMAQGFSEGDEVYASPSLVRDGANAEFVCVDARLVAHRPYALSFEEAAAMPLATITAWEALHKHARIKSSDTVLIHAGAGGVGHLAIQLAKLVGCTVISTAGRAETLQVLEDQGVSHAIDYRAGDVTDQVMEITRGRGCDVVLDLVGGTVFTSSLACAAQNGRVVTIVPGVPTEDFNTLFARNVSVHFEFMGIPGMTGEGMQEQAHVLRAAARLANDGLLTPIVSKIHPLAELAEAHRQQETGRTIGKQVVIP
jgi:NADPH2:quinone reductase